MYPIVKFFYRSIEYGAQTQIMMSVEPQLKIVSGKYFVGCAEKEISARARDDALGKWLWSCSENLTKLI
jgi:retinol dehydrogenase 12